MKQFFKHFWPYLKEYKLLWIFVFIGVLGAVLGTVGAAEILKRLVDDVLIPKNGEMLYIVSSFFIILYLIKGAGRYMQSYFINYIGQDIVRKLRDQLLDHMLHLDIDFFQKAKSGELISRISNDIARIQAVVANFIPEIIRDTMVILGLLAYSIYLNPQLAFYSLIIMPITIYPLNRLAKRMKRISHISQEKNAEITIRLSEIFNNNEIIQANSTQKQEVQRFSKHNKEFFKINMKAVKTTEFVSPMMEVFGSIGVAAVLIAGGLSVINNDITQGSLIAFLTAIGMLYDPMKKMASLLNRMQEASAAAERVFLILKKHPIIKNGMQTKIGNITKISFHNVSLNYDLVQALKSISFSVKKGENIALIGDSGGGKSSLVNLLLRFYDVSQGSVKFNEINIKNFELKSLRSHIAMVSQRVYIFADTLALNVSYGCPYDEKRIIESLKKADALQFVSNLKNGIHTIMEEFGSNLSGGQRQRIAIARAVYKNADILILDEATSSLDNQSEKRIQKALKDICKDKITFTIAHRLTTTNLATNILLFKDGKIIDHGTHEELLQSSNEYKKLRGNSN